MIALSSAPRPLGDSGPAFAPLAWNFRPAAAARPDSLAQAVEAARGAGFGMIAISDQPFPGSGLRFGEAAERLGTMLRADPTLREGWLLAVRGGVGPGSICDNRPDSLEAGLEATLARLGAPRADLFLLQRPDLLVHPREAAAGLSRLVARGLAGAVGVANHPAAALRVLVAHLDIPLAAVELPLSALDLGALLDGGLDLAMELGATVLAAAPLSEGQIGDRPGLAASVTARATIRALDGVAGQQGVGRAAVAAAFVAGHAARPVPLFGTQEPAELRAAPEVFRVRLDRADWYRILEAALGER
jgi:predicted oxidoreductase